MGFKAAPAKWQFSRLQGPWKPTACLSASTLLDASASSRTSSNPLPGYGLEGSLTVLINQRRKIQELQILTWVRRLLGKYTTLQVIRPQDDSAFMEPIGCLYFTRAVDQDDLRELVVLSFLFRLAPKVIFLSLKC